MICKADHRLLTAALASVLATLALGGPLAAAPGEDAIADRRVFDDPLRSQRGRTITHGFRFVLDHLPAPPLAVGADDAAAADRKSVV